MTYNNSAKNNKRPTFIPPTNILPEDELVGHQINYTNSHKLVIFSDSILAILRKESLEKRMQEKVDINIQAIRGGTTNRVANSANDYLKNNAIPDSVIIHTGINDLLQGRSEEDVVDDIMNFGKFIIDKRVKNVFISSITKSFRLEEYIVMNVNRILKAACSQLGFTFINHENILEKHIWRDGLHMANSGLGILSSNFSYFINNFLGKMKLLYLST